MAATQRKMETFNSMKHFELLKKAGIPEAQARAQVEMVQEASRSGLEHLATREELKEAVAELKLLIKTSKWQTIGTISVLIIGGFFTKHFGF